MRGDFSRETFDPLRRFSRVLMQQGRVQLDADWNEQTAIQLHLLRSLAADLIGPHGGPGDGFAIKDTEIAGAAIKNDFAIEGGHYYVDGWLCENGARAFYRGTPSPAGPPTQPPQPHSPALIELKNGERYLAYLDVWERHLSYAETDGSIETELRTPPLLRELALGGADTTSRAQVIWQIQVGELPDRDFDGAIPADQAAWRKWIVDHWDRLVEKWEAARRGRLKAEARKSDTDDDKGPCAISPESRFRGLENQLYRVEVHRAGAARDDKNGGRADDAATFKWSRENGSVVFPIQEIGGKTITLANWWRDDRFGLAVGQWVEVVTDITALQHRADTLRRVTGIDRETLTVTLDAAPGVIADPAQHPLLRRWDYRARQAGKGAATSLASDNAVYVVEDKWITLEDGVQVYFEKAADNPAHRYRTGDYWLIPGRTAIGDVLWPRRKTADGSTEAVAAPPHGIDHHFAPLAIVTFDAVGTADVVSDLRRHLKPLAEPVP